MLLRGLLTRDISATNVDISNNLSVDTISEYTAEKGVTIDSVLLKNNTITAHTISAQNYAVGSTKFCFSFQTR